MNNNDEILQSIIEGLQDSSQARLNRLLRGKGTLEQEKPVRILSKASEASKLTTEQLKEMVKEHERLIHRMHTTTRKDDKKELAIQAKELEGYKRELKRRLNKADGTYFVNCAVLSFDGSKILLGCRREDGIWTGPGGRSNEGETPKEAALREMSEETGIVAKPEQLIELSTLTGKGNKPVFCFLLRLSQNTEFTVLADPDKEISAWGWYSTSQPLPEPMDKIRHRTAMNGIMTNKSRRSLGKALSINEENQGISLDSNDFSIDELAAKNHPMLSQLHLMLDGMNYGDAPRQMTLENGYTLTLSRDSDGIYSGSVKRAINDDLGSEDRAFNIEKMHIPGIVQTLKARGYINDIAQDSQIVNEENDSQADAELGEQVEDMVEDHEAEWEGQEGTPAEQDADAQEFEQVEDLVEQHESMQREELSEILDALQDRGLNEIHIHFHKALEALSDETLQKVKELSIGTMREWGGIKYQKLANNHWQKVPENNHEKKSNEDNFKKEKINETTKENVKETKKENEKASSKSEKESKETSEKKPKKEEMQKCTEAKKEESIEKKKLAKAEALRKDLFTAIGNNLGRTYNIPKEGFINSEEEYLHGQSIPLEEKSGSQIRSPKSMDETYVKKT